MLLGRGLQRVDVHGVPGLLLEVLGGEVRGVDLGLEARLKGGAEAAQIVEVDAREEGVPLDFLGAAAAEARVSSGYEAEGGGAGIVSWGLGGGGGEEEEGGTDLLIRCSE